MHCHMSIVEAEEHQSGNFHGGVYVCHRYIPTHPITNKTVVEAEDIFQVERTRIRASC